MIGRADNLKNIFGIAFSAGDEIYAGGDDGTVYVFRQDKVEDRKFAAESTSVQILGFVNKGDQVLLMTIGDEGKISFWEDSKLVNQSEIIDEEIKYRLGSENIILSPRAHCYREGTLILGFEQNLIMKLSISTGKVSFHPVH